MLGLNPTRGTDNVKPKPDHISGLTISSCLLFAFPLNVARTSDMLQSTAYINICRPTTADSTQGLMKTKSSAVQSTALNQALLIMTSTARFTAVE